MNIFQYSSSDLRSLIGREAVSLAVETDADRAAFHIAGVLKMFTLFDLQIIGGNIYREVERLPCPYREEYRPFSQDLFNQYHALMAECKRAGGAEGKRQIADAKVWEEFWRVTPAVCFGEGEGRGGDSPAGRFFYRMVYGYVMMIKGEPGHPVGLVFPGGWRVRREGDVVYCPIRDKEKDLPQALCNSCPAKQDPAVL